MPEKSHLPLDSLPPRGGERTPCPTTRGDEAEAARTELKQFTEILRFASESSGIVPWYVVPDTGFEYIAGNIGALLGRGDIGRVDADRFREWMHPDDISQVLKDYQAILLGEIQAMEHDVRLQRQDGGWSWFNSRARRIDRSAQGLPDMVCGTYTDITARKAAEEELARALEDAEAARNAAETSAEMLRIAAFCGEMGAWCVCPDLGEAWLQDEGFRQLGYEPGAFLPDIRGWRRKVHPDDLPSADAGILALQEGRLEVLDLPLRMRHADGSYHWYRSIARRIDRSARQLPPLIAGAHTCIDALKENEERLSEAAEAARRAGERLNTLADNAPGALFEYRMDTDGRVNFPYFSANLPEIMSVPREELEADGEAIFQAIHPDDLPDIAAGIEASRTRMERFTAKCRVISPDRGERLLLCSSIPFAQEDGSVIWFGNIFDITEQEAAERRAAASAEAVRRAHERLSSIAAVAPVGLYEYRKQPDGTEDFPYMSPRFADLMGVSGAGADGSGESILARVHPDDLASVVQSSARASAEKSVWSQRFRVVHPERGIRWLSGSATPREKPDGTLIWTGALHDVTEDETREAELRAAHRSAEAMRAENERQALHDGLTGLPNRRYFDLMMERRFEGARAGREVQACGLIRIDLDHFKHVNDTLGHAAGDTVLRRVAEVLRISVRGSDFAARIGGDEFSIILGPTMTAENAREIVERIQARLAEPVFYEGRPCRFGASFGIAHTDDITSEGAELQVFADAALYRAKEGGRNRMEFFTTTLHQNILDDRRLGEELHEALERETFVPHFQPQISTRTGEMIGVETLLRWPHPTRGMLQPDDFMRLAEQMRIVPEIDRIMMERTQEALRRWRASGVVIPKISFNVSSGRMHDPGVVALARRMAQGPTKVTFELLESILVEEESDVFRFHLDAIREAGIEIEIDDFGSGHASIISLMEINPTALKIDRRIVAPVARDDRSRNLVRAIVEIAETLGIGTVAEGVETEDQARILRETGCDVLQGYLFARALDEDELLRFASRMLKRPA